MPLFIFFFIFYCEIIPAIFFLKTHFVGFPQEQSDVQVLPAEVSPSGGQNNGWSGPPSGFTRPWPPTNSYAGPMGYSVPGWRQPQPRMWPSQPSYNTRPWRSFPQPVCSMISIVYHFMSLLIPGIKFWICYAC